MLLVLVASRACASTSCARGLRDSPKLLSNSTKLLLLLLLLVFVLVLLFFFVALLEATSLLNLGYSSSRGACKTRTVVRLGAAAVERVFKFSLLPVNAGV